MAKIENVEVSGIKCQLYKIPMRKMLLLDRKVIDLLGPIMGSFAGMNPDEEANMEKIFGGIGKALATLDDHAYEALLDDLLGSVVAQAPGKVPLQLTGANLDVVMEDQGMMVVYKIIMEVLKFNKFLPFDLGDLASLAGTATPTIAG